MSHDLKSHHALGSNKFFGIINQFYCRCECPILRQAVAKASEFGTVLGSGLLVSLNLVLMSKVLASYLISSIGVSKMASRIINSGLADAHESQSTDTIGFFMIFIFRWVVCYFSLIPFPYFNPVPKQHSRQCKSQFDLAVWKNIKETGNRTYVYN
jgi:hypothetical protein